MEIAYLHDLFKAQYELDATIAKNHNVTYENTLVRRIMALVVEVGELANATRCFKFWSNKSSEPKEVVLDEYADGLHFLLSLGIAVGSTKENYEIVKESDDLTEQFLNVYHQVDLFRINKDIESYEKAFSSFLALMIPLGYTWKELEEAYYKKLGVNFHRQETNY